MAKLPAVQFINELDKVYFRKSEDLKLFQPLWHCAICCLQMKLWGKVLLAL